MSYITFKFSLRFKLVGPSNARSLNPDASSRYAIQHTSLSVNQNAAFTNQEDSFTHRGGMHLYRNSSNSQFTRGAPDSGQDQRRVLGSGDQVGVQPHAGGGGDLASAASQSQVYYSSMATTDCKFSDLADRMVEYIILINQSVICVPESLTYLEAQRFYRFLFNFFICERTLVYTNSPL